MKIELFSKIKNWEQWPFKVLYAPIAPVWVWYMIRSRAVWFFTPSNPKLTFGGLDGEPKKEMHDLLPPEFCPSYFNIKPSDPFPEIKKKLKFSGIKYPLIVKPEVGGQGILFRKIENEEHLKEYHSKIPVEYFIQEFIEYPVEVSLFYYRFPNEKKGAITGFLQKVPMRVTGDGVHNLGQLLLQNVKTKKRLAELKQKHEINFEKIIPAGEVYILSYAGNHNRGADFFDLGAEINDDLVNLLDKISLGINDFFYGRYDIMCNSIEELKQGKNFVILEYNGCGAEPNHFYDTGYTLIGAWKEILKHWKILFEISRYNHKHGVPYWPLLKGLRFRRATKKYYNLINKVDKEIS
ncbi:MAG: hypothetical protein KGM16_04380 [Bacteroidota bacterium]|nr:hypothetical protein [Bacteroidota bacterium]